MRKLGGFFYFRITQATRVRRLEHAPRASTAKSQLCKWWRG
jgi:hypothetical protein